MMATMRSLGFVPLLAALAACAPRAPARTLGRGRSEVAASLGGPLFGNLGAPLPLPMAAVGGRHGVTDAIDAIGHVQITAAAYGVAGGDLGAAYQLLRSPHAAVAATARASAFSDGTALRVFPELAVVGDRRWGARWALLYGVTALAQPTPPRDKPYLFVAPSVGVESSLGDGMIGLDLMWISPWQDATSVVDWQPGRGAIAVRLGYRRGVR